jgi:hypothetical protein
VFLAVCGAQFVIACDKREAFAQGSNATKQSILSLRGAMDCFASLAMTENLCISAWFQPILFHYATAMRSRLSSGTSLERIASESQTQP